MKQIHGAPLRKVVLKDRVSELIKTAILSGRLEAGDRIVEMKLAEDLGVGTTSVREALFELESQGFVTRVTNKGTFVTELTKDDIAQIVRVRRELEGLAAELAAERVTPSEVSRLRDIVSHMHRAAGNNDLENFYRSDLEFHRCIWELSGNRHLVKALDITVVPLFAFFIMKNPSDSVEELRKSADWHGQVVDAIAGVKGAREAMEAALKFFNEQENWMLFDAAERSES